MKPQLIFGNKKKKQKSIMDLNQKQYQTQIVVHHHIQV